MTRQALSARSSAAQITPKKILVPSDFSAASNYAFKYAMQFGQEFGAELHVIHVLAPALTRQFPGLPGAQASEEELATTEKNLRAWTDSAKALGVRIKLVLRCGLPTHEIVEAAKELDVDLVIIATLGHTGWKYLCIGSTAERVVRAAPCPVLVVREKEHDFL